MLHVSGELRQSPYAVLDLFFPETYAASTLTDLVDNMSQLQPTRSVLPLGVFFYGQAVVFLETSVVFTRLSPYHGELTDLNGSVVVRTNDLPREKQFLLEDGLRLFMPMMSVDVADNEVVLRNYKLHGPEEAEKARQPVMVPHGAFIF